MIGGFRLDEAPPPTGSPSLPPPPPECGVQVSSIPKGGGPTPQHTAGASGKMVEITAAVKD